MILAGGGGTRLGGQDKPMLPVAGVPMLDRVLAAVEGAALRIVVGPPREGLPAGVRTVREEPPGAGPAAATAAALGLVPRAAAEEQAEAKEQAEAEEGPALVGLFAADLPYLTAEGVGVLVAAVGSHADGAVFVDGRGKRQLLCGVWRAGALRDAVERLGAPEGRSMRAVLDGLDVVEVEWTGSGPAPYFDCDTEEDLRRADRTGT
ncbi:NTP transferase domain-containing protein [Dactylosporangium sp. NPDC049742]|uniref:molybdenum cofactor guanylyltransferase n=1 Tax=Dactylosporangium sp. NPDC049742 TaxID=3154737 RepID=UPI00343395E1